jgi:AraC-like DNA-binding protein
MFNLLKIAAVIAIFQMFLLVLFLNTRKNRNNSNKILSLILLVYTVQICLVVFMTSFPNSLLVKFNSFPAYCHQFALLFGPLIWFYSKSMVNRKISKWEWLHILPFIVMILYVTTRKIIDPGYLIWFSPFKYYSSALILVQSLVYLLITGYFILRKLDLYKGHLKSSIHLLGFYSFLIFGFISLWILKFNTFLYIDIWRKYKICPYASSLYFIVGFLFFNILVGLALIKPELFNWKRKYHKSNLSQAKKEEITNALIKMMEVEKIYSDSSLTLSVLAKKMGILVPYLSQIINEEFNLSFPEYVNSFRIKEAERLLLNFQAEFTIQQIMYEVGFSSRSVFINVFKKFTGYTPTEYRKNSIH